MCMYCWAGEPYSEKDCKCKCINVHNFSDKKDTGFCIVCNHRVDIISLKKYTENLLSRISKYDESKIHKCIESKYYVEAIDNLHIQIYEELQFLIVKRVKHLNNIEIDENDPRFPLVLNMFRRIEGKALFDISFIFGRINVSQYNTLIKLNTMRNVFSHSFEKRANYKEREIISTLNKAIEIEKLLENAVNQTKLTGDFSI